jgi:O-antigen ligase
LTAAAVAGDGDAPPATNWRLSARTVPDATIAILVFLGGFVMVEPAPYDLLLVAAAGVWAVFGLRLDRHFMPLTVLVLVYAAGGFLSLTQVDAALGRPLVHMLTSLFLVISAVFFAAVIVEDPARRLTLIRRAYVASAVVVAIIGILAYFDAIPGADAFKLYDRAKGTFKDPNVFGPFLALPLAILARDILTRRLRNSIMEIVLFLVVLFAVFLSFSRAAWGMAVVVLLIVAVLAYINERSPLARFRLSAYLIGGAVALSVMLAAAITIPAVSDLYAQRALVVQEYDASPTGRFERQQQGFFLIQEKPLGIGPFEFGKRFGEDEHNTWLKAFTVYGWLGGFSYAALALWTLAAATPLLFKPRPWQPLIQCAYAVFVGHLLVHSVIDANHWRHLFLIYGILWAAIAAEKMRQGAEQRRAEQWPRRHRVAGALALPRMQVPGAVRRTAAVPRAKPMADRAALRQG